MCMHINMYVEVAVKKKGRGACPVLHWSAVSRAPTRRHDVTAALTQQLSPRPDVTAALTQQLSPPAYRPSGCSLPLVLFTGCRSPTAIAQYFWSSVAECRCTALT